MTDCGTTETKAAPSDDMSQWPSWPQGISAEAFQELEKTRTAIGCVFDEADTEASSNLTRHQWAAGLLGFGGTYAVLMAIFQLYLQVTSAGTEKNLAAKALAAPGTTLGRTFGAAEIFFAVLALAALAAGLKWNFMGDWLLQRHRAERCRFLKFEFLLHVALAARDEESLRRAARQYLGEADVLKEMGEDQMEQWLREEQVLPNPPAVPARPHVLSDLRVLAEHYVHTRLGVQSLYFSKQSNRDNRRSSRTGNVTPLLFGTSTLLALVHFAIEHRFHSLEAASPFFILMAAALPVIGAGLRSARGISEYSRNALRFSAKYNALKPVIIDLQNNMSGQASRAQDIVQSLWKGEQILEGEHREWLRLMIETEWIG